MPSNPHMQLVDLIQLKKVLKSYHHILLIVDSTFASPYNFKPSQYGADLVMQSCTKYLSGNANVMAGCISGPKYLIKKIRHFRNILGLRLFQNRILSDLEDSMLASGIDISQRYYHASVDWSMQWGPGYMMFFFITIFLFVWYIDKYLFGKVLNLSSYWKARGHLVFISLLILYHKIAHEVLLFFISYIVGLCFNAKRC